MNEKICDTKFIAVSALQENSGQIAGVPRNPRKIDKTRLAKLAKSLKDSPEMLQLRELIAFDNGGELVVVCGNMRLRAAKEAGLDTLPVKILPHDTPAEKIREYAIKDNVAFGEDDLELLEAEWDAGELDSWGWQDDDAINITAEDFGETFDLNDGEKPYVETVSFMLASEQAEFIKKQLGAVTWVEADTFGNKNKNGNAIFKIVSEWANVKK